MVKGGGGRVSICVFLRWFLCFWCVYSPYFKDVESNLEVTVEDGTKEPGVTSRVEKDLRGQRRVYDCSFPFMVWVMSFGVVSHLEPTVKGRFESQVPRSFLTFRGVTTVVDNPE